MKRFDVLILIIDFNYVFVSYRKKFVVSNEIWLHGCTLNYILRTISPMLRK